jgi:hypothetical protein
MIALLGCSASGVLLRRVFEPGGKHYGNLSARLNNHPPNCRILVVPILEKCACADFARTLICP